MFSGMLPVALANFKAFNFAETTPYSIWPLEAIRRAAAVAGLHGGADLQVARVVENTAERAEQILRWSIVCRT